MLAISLNATKRLSLAASFLLFAASSLLALDPNRSISQYLHRVWQVQNGLPRTTIFSICQAADGYLWLGTQTGLVRFDGLKFTELPELGGVSLANERIVQIVEDHQHTLWIATSSAGLIKYKDGVATAFTETHGLPSNHVQALLVDRQNTLWVGTERGLVRVSDSKVLPFSATEGQADLSIHALCQAGDNIWGAGNTNVALRWNGQQLTRLALPSSENSSGVTVLLGASDGTLWIGTNNGLLCRLPHGEVWFTEAEGLVNDHILSLMRSSDGTVWVGTKGGIGRIKDQELENYGTKDGLSQNAVHALCEDREGHLWVGTKHGLNEFVDRRTIPFTVNEGLPSNDVGPVIQDRTGKIWIGMMRDGLTSFDGKNWESRTVSNGLASNNILSLANDPHDGLWIGTDQGINLLREGKISEKFWKEQGLPSNRISCLHFDRQGVLWAGTETGLASLREEKFVETTEMGLPRAPILAIAGYRSRGLVVSTEGAGVFLAEEGKFRALDVRASAVCDAIFADAEGLIWIGTRGEGLRLFDGEHVKSFTTKDGLFDDDIYGITADDQDRLWLACSKGIFSVARTELRHMAAGIQKSLNCETYSPTESQRTIECRPGIQPAVWKTTDDKIWFTTIRGLISVDAKQTRRKLPPIPVVLEETIVNGQAVDVTEDMILPAGSSNLIFRYTGLSFASPARITFRYKLEGYDRDWVNAGTRREAIYTNLPPGQYEFQLAATNIDGQSNELESPLRFAIEPALYQRRWFLAACLGLALAGIVTWYRLRMQTLQQQTAAINDERSRIARELHDTLLQGFSGITMEMQALSSRLQSDDEQAAMREIIDDAAQCLREARHTVAGLRSGSEAGRNFREKLAETAQRIVGSTVSLRLQLQTEPTSLRADTEYQLLRIAQEAISNAARHAQASSIEVRLATQRGKTVLTIADDGAGFQQTNGVTAVHDQFGLVGMRERTKQIGGQFYCRSQPGQGTTIEIVLPGK
jgi:ligand-binding sensor domain-containing protein/signal transduction histidine kinase